MNYPPDIVERLRSIDQDDLARSSRWVLIRVQEAADEIERLRAGGCARNQRATQYCAEAATLQRKIDVLNDTLLNSVKACDLVREQRDTLDRELERVKIALANAVSERDRAREGWVETKRDLAKWQGKR
jgi:hypothetical protein